MVSGRTGKFMTGTSKTLGLKYNCFSVSSMVKFATSVRVD